MSASRTLARRRVPTAMSAARSLRRRVICCATHEKDPGGKPRRECLGHVVVFGERHLWNLLRCYRNYYNECRWAKMRRARAQFRSAAALPLTRSWRITSSILQGLSFRQGHPGSWRSWLAPETSARRQCDLKRAADRPARRRPESWFRTQN
jgi:hypothetical protein